MYKELEALFTAAEDHKATLNDYCNAVCIDNCTRKATDRTKKDTFNALKKLYILNSEKVIFRALRYFWDRDVKGRSRLAYICAYAQDSILRETTEVILKQPIDKEVSKDLVQTYIERLYENRFSNVMRASLTRNLRSSWTQAQYLCGKVIKKRISNVTAGAVAYALLLAYLNGGRGHSLFYSNYAKLLDCSVETAIELAEETARKGWIVFKRIGNIMEILFPNILTEQEMGWIREQN